MELRGKHIDELEHALAAGIESAMREFVAAHPHLEHVAPNGGHDQLHHLMAKAAAAVLEGHIAGR